MDFSKNSFKKILAVVFTLVISTPFLVAQTVSPVVYTINFVSDFELSVHVALGENNSKYQVYIFPSSIPNYYKNENYRNEISDFKTISKDQSSEYKNISDSIFLAANTSSFSYTVLLDSLHKTSFLPIQSAASKDLKLLNFSTFLGFVNTVSAPMQLLVLHKGTRVYKQTASFQFFQEQPLCLGCKAQQIAKNTKKIRVETQQSLLEQTKLNSIISEAFVAFEYMNFNKNFEGKKLIIILDTLSKNTGAIAHPNTIVFYFDDVDIFTIQKTIIHELVHWAVPDLHTWLNEGVAEFLAIKFMRKAALLSNEKFLNIMATKMQEASFFEAYSLHDVYRNKTSFSLAQNYSALYTKGAVMAWLLDLLIFEHSNKKIALETYVLQDLANMQGIDQSYLIEKVIAFETGYIKTNIGFSYNKFLHFVGVLFEQNKIAEVKAIENIVLEKNGADIIILDNGGVNLLSENDLLLSIDKEKRWSEINKILKTNNTKPNTFSVVRNGEKKSIKISGKDTISIRKRYVLSFFETITSQQKANWLAYING